MRRLETAGQSAGVRTQVLWHSKTFPCRIVPTWSRPEASAEAPSITNSVPRCVSLMGSDRIREAKPWDIFISWLFPLHRASSSEVTESEPVVRRRKVATP